jgi:hypothetical protein
MILSVHIKDALRNDTLEKILKTSRNQKWIHFSNPTCFYCLEISAGTVVEAQFGAYKQIFPRIKSRLRRLPDNQ